MTLQKTRYNRVQQVFSVQSVTIVDSKGSEARGYSDHNQGNCYADGRRDGEPDREDC